MKKHFIHILIIGLLVASCHHKEEDFPGYEQPTAVPSFLYFAKGEIPELDADGGEYKIPIRSNVEWTVKWGEEWIQADKDKGYGNDTLCFRVASNYGTVRNVQLELTSKNKKIKNILPVQQASGHQPMGSLGFDKGAGFGYDIKADYCKGMTFQIFNLKRLSYLQQHFPVSYIYDSYQTSSVDEIAEGETEEELSEKLSAGGSIGMNVLIFKADINGSYTNNKLTASKTVFGMKRTKRVLFMRDIQYANIVAQMYTDGGEQDSLLAPGFYTEWKAFNEHCDEGNAAYYIEDFIDKWGLAFVSRSYLGGSIDYEMEINKEVIKEDMTIHGALEASLASIVNVGASVDYKTHMEKLKSNYRYSIMIRGGDAQRISILTTGGYIKTEQYQSWVESIRIDKEHPERSQVALTDIQIVPIYELFRGKAYQALKEHIDNITKK